MNRTTEQWDASLLQKLAPEEETEETKETKETEEASKELGKSFLEGLKDGNLSTEMLLQLRLPKSLHELIPFSPIDLYQIAATPSYRMEGEEFEEYKVRRRLKSKIDKKRVLLNQMEMLPTTKQYLRLKEELAEKELDGETVEESGNEE